VTFTSIHRVPPLPRSSIRFPLPMGDGTFEEFRAAMSLRPATDDDLNDILLSIEYTRHIHTCVDDALLSRMIKSSQNSLVAILDHQLPLPLIQIVATYSCQYYSNHPIASLLVSMLLGLITLHIDVVW
jgi:hypothetical protein